MIPGWAAAFLAVTVPLLAAEVGARPPAAAPTGLAHSVLRFVNFETAAAVRPASVRIDGKEAAGFVGADGILEVDLAAGGHAIDVTTPGFHPMHAWHGAAVPRSLLNTFELLPLPLPGDAPRNRQPLSADYAFMGQVREWGSRAAIPAARVSFESPVFATETRADGQGAFWLAVPESALNGTWRLRAEAAAHQSRELAGQGTGDLPRVTRQNFLLLGPDGAGLVPAGHRVLVLPETPPRAARAFGLAGLQACPSTIRVGLGVPLAAAQTCSGMNAKCSSAFNACVEVDVVDTEVYVKRVFRGELYGTLIWSDAQKDCFKANAVAIRSYAAWHALSGPRGAEYDLCNGDNCQCYFSGFTAFGPISTAASEETAGQVLLDASGRIARAEYGSWNGSCARGIMHCDFLPIYDYAIDLHWDLRPSQPGLWGHGRGLSQYGSHFRAKDAEDYRAILSFYYQDYGWRLSADFPLLLSGPRWQKGSFQFVLRGPPGGEVVTEASPDLEGWSVLSTNTLPVTGAVLIEDPGAVAFRPSFYRARFTSR